MSDSLQGLEIELSRLNTTIDHVLSKIAYTLDLRLEQIYLGLDELIKELKKK